MNNNYEVIKNEINSIAGFDEYPISDLANISSVLFNNMENINWAGFYFAYKGILRLATFNGKPACTEISYKRGVCGYSYSNDEAIVVPNVHEFKGHIACDSASNSEIVIPIHYEGKKIGLLDIDSYKLNNFDNDDLENLKEVVKIIENKVNFKKLENVLYGGD